MSTELLELVHTLGKAVEDLSLLVSGVPAMVDGKLDAMQVTFTSTVVQLRNQMEELQSEAGSVRGQLNSLSGALAVQLTDQRDELVSVIGDNRTVADKQVQDLTDRVTAFEGRYKELSATLDSASASILENVTGLRTEVETVRSTLGEELAAQRVVIGEVRQACDTTDLSHGIAQLKHRATEIETSVEQVSLGVTKLALQTDGRFDEQQSTVQQLAARVGEIKPFDQTPINERFDSLEEQLHNTTSKADTTAARVNEVVQSVEPVVRTVEGHSASLQALTERVGEIQPPFDPAPLVERATRIEQGLLETTERVKAIGDKHEEFVAVVEGHATSLQALTERVGEIKPFDQQPLVERLAQIERSLLETADHVKTMGEGHTLFVRTVETHAGSLAALEGRISEIKPFDPTELNDAITAVRTALAQHSETVSALGAEVQKQIDIAVAQGEAVTSNHMAVQQAMADYEQTVVNRIVDDKFNADVRIADIVENIGLLNKAIADVREDAAKEDARVRLLVGTTGEGFEKGLATLMQQTEELAQQVSTYRVGAEEIQARLHGLAKNAESFATREQVEADARKLAESLEKFGGSFAETLANIEASLRSSFGEQLETVRDALGKRIDELPAPPELPAPFDPSELRASLFTELSARLGELAPEIPEPQFDVRFDDQTLVVSLTMGDKVVTRTTTLGLGIEYLGVYKHGEEYKAGNLVTHKGSMWFAKSKPTGEPGKDIMGWQLAVKCGRDGKDATPTRAYAGHMTGRVYRETDFLRINNRLWQCTVKETSTVPEPGDITSSAEWTLIGGIQ